MHILRHSHYCPVSVQHSTLVIGKFDAIHHGHRYVIRQALDQASQTNTPLMVMTFHPHPAMVFAPSLPPITILPLAERSRGIAK